MIDLQAAKGQISGITREVLRRYADPQRRRAAAEELLESVAHVAQHLDVKMAAPVAAAPTKADPIAGQPKRRRAPTKPVGEETAP